MVHNNFISMNVLAIICTVMIQTALAVDGPLSLDAVRVKEMVDAAHVYACAHSRERDRVQKIFSEDPRFSDSEKNLYVFMHTYDRAKGQAVCWVQGKRPELIGKNMWTLRTPNGRLLFHEIENMIETNGQGWIEYQWLNPFTRKLGTKLSYVRKITLADGRKAWIGIGLWK